MIVFRYEYLSTPCGSLSIIWSEKGFVVRLFLGVSKRQLVKNITCDLSHKYVTAKKRPSTLSRQIAEYFEGDKVVFDLTICNLSVLKPFQYKVLKAEQTIPYGRVSTYGGLAHTIGHPGAARAVGRALATNPFPLIIPCHRTVKADGSIGGFQGGAAMKRYLLELEGVTFLEQGRVAPECFV